MKYYLIHIDSSIDDTFAQIVTTETGYAPRFYSYKVYKKYNHTLLKIRANEEYITLLKLQYPSFGVVEYEQTNH